MSLHTDLSITSDGEIRLDRQVELAFRGDWGQANFTRICGWLGQEVGDRVSAGSRFAIWNGRGGRDQADALAAGEVDVAVMTPAAAVRTVYTGAGPFGGSALTELRVVIGRPASRVPREKALEYVFGYVPLLDITIRGAEDRSFRKSYDSFTPIGPAIVTADEVPDPTDIAFRLSVNGEERQKSTTKHLIYDIARLVELYSGAMTLQPGDLIATGTPEGVGPIVAGDRVDLWIDGVGYLSMLVRARDR